MVSSRMKEHSIAGDTCLGGLRWNKHQNEERVLQWVEKERKVKLESTGIFEKRIIWWFVSDLPLSLSFQSPLSTLPCTHSSLPRAAKCIGQRTPRLCLPWTQHLQIGILSSRSQQCERDKKEPCWGPQFSQDQRWWSRKGKERGNKEEKKREDREVMAKDLMVEKEKEESKQAKSECKKRVRTIKSWTGSSSSSSQTSIKTTSPSDRSLLAACTIVGFTTLSSEWRRKKRAQKRAKDINEEVEKGGLIMKRDEGQASEWVNQSVYDGHWLGWMKKWTKAMWSMKTACFLAHQ